MPEPKKPDDIQYAHDVLAAILYGQAPIHVPDAIRDQMMVALSVLCWALGHGNDVFAVNLAKCEEMIARVQPGKADEPKPTVH